MSKRTNITRLLDRGRFNDRTLRHLGWSMAFIAGALNAGGFLAVHRYTSHMSGIVSGMADEFALGEVTLGLSLLVMLLCFIAGAMHSSWLILWARRQRLRGGYGVSMMEEAGLLLLFGLLGAALSLHKGFFTPLTVMLLCFIMGMHNTIVTKLSGGLLRSTHMTGIATDIGIELAKLSYYGRESMPKVKDVRANRVKLRTYLLILLSFFGGGVVGALGFKHMGYSFTLPLALLLFLLGLRPVWYDVRLRFRLWRIQLESH
ncbi:membrane protein [Chromobacterium sp. LK11]|uniref:YoaK family protein n=1 Tax=Chromobacterium sp. LK11 TaxID=1628212 RepID=UPI0006545747|nr:YoaK family protein [Chromobacterium sp. LK11]KMN82525.1 membrane protein [Chromobacterium sp. LK11]